MPAACPIKKAARDAGEQFYVKPCKFGHEGKRNVNHGACLECNRERMRVWKADEANQERARERARRYAKEKSAEAVARAAKWARENPERNRALKNKWKRDNWDKVQPTAMLYRARKFGAEGRYTKADVDRLKAQQKGRCACCAAKKRLTVDHIVPLVRGGSNWPSNLQLLCMSCNTSKSGRDPVLFMRSRGLLL
jgi:5-methylcytosine-specific restriction endonuclease McrA